jgi:hypothetical protein
VSLAQVPPGKSGSVRVWFLRSTTDTNPAVEAFSPVIYANGAPVAAIPTETAFYRDFAPGTYRFMVQTNGLPTPQATSLQLAPGTEYFLDVDWVASWTLGLSGEIAGDQNAATFGIIPMRAQVAQAYLPTLHYLGAQ